MQPTIYYCFSVLLLLSVTICATGAAAFVITSKARQSPVASHRQLFAKPPPASNFDLNAIEAFESLLEEQEQAENDIGHDHSHHHHHHHHSHDHYHDDDDDEYADDNDDEVLVYTIPPELDNKRIDAVISTLYPSLSRSSCSILVTYGRVLLLSSACDDEAVEQNDKPTLINKKSFKVQAGQVIQVSVPREQGNDDGNGTDDWIVPQELPLDILYEDEYMIVLNKAANMVVHPAAGNWDGTVVNALQYYLQYSPMGGGDFVKGSSSTSSSSTGATTDSTKATLQETNNDNGEVASLRPGIVHRLDKGTTGVLVVAKTRSALTALSEAFAARNVKKTYLAVTVGNPGKDVTIDKPIGRHPVYRQRMRVVPDPHRKNSSGMAPKDRLSNRNHDNDTDNARSLSQGGRRAISFVDTLAFDGRLALTQVRIQTGRTHQIRVHLQDRRTPIYGDDVYGLEDWNKKLRKTHLIERPLLHAYQLELQHPVSGERMVFTAPLPADMLRVAKAICPQGEEEFPQLFLSSTR